GRSGRDTLTLIKLFSPHVNRVRSRGWVLATSSPLLIVQASCQLRVRAFGLSRLVIQSGLKNPVGCSKDFLGRLLGDYIAFKPVLNVASAVFRAAQTKRFINE